MDSIPPSFASWNVELNSPGLPQRSCERNETWNLFRLRITSLPHVNCLLAISEQYSEIQKRSICKSQVIFVVRSCRVEVFRHNDELVCCVISSLLYFRIPSSDGVGPGGASTLFCSVSILIIPPKPRRFAFVI